jgi:hypothetical protein
MLVIIALILINPGVIALVFKSAFNMEAGFELYLV